MEKSKTIKWAIITPVFNRESELVEMIESVLVQTYQDWFLYIVDNTSCPCSYEVAKRYSKRDPRIKILQCAVQGVNHARNVGIEMASGDYAILLDSDNSFIDENILNVISEMIPKISDQPPLGIFSPSAIDGVQQKLPKGCSGYIDFSSYFRYVSQELLPIVNLQWLKNVKFPVWRGGYESYLWYRLAMTGRMYLLELNIQVYSTKSSNRICASPRDQSRCLDLMNYYGEILLAYSNEMEKACRWKFLLIQSKYAIYKRISMADGGWCEREPNIESWIRIIISYCNREFLVTMMRLLL